MRENMKKIICLLLVLCMAAGLCACGSESTSAATTATSNPAAASTATPDANGNVYQTSYCSVKTDTYLWSNLADSNGFLTVVREVVGNNTPEGVTPEYEGQFDVYENHLYRIGFDGSKTQLTGYVPLPMESEHANGQVYVSTYAMGSGPDGKLVSIEDRYEMWNDDEETVLFSDEWYNGMQYVDTYYLRVMNADGSEISTNVIDTSAYGYFYPNSVTMDASGNVILTIDSDVLVLSTDGEILQDIPCTSGYAYTLVNLDDGNVYAVLEGSGSNGENLLAQVNVEAGSFGETCTLPDNAYSVVKGTGDFAIYYSSGSALYGMNPGDANGTLILNWISCDVNSSEICGIATEADGTVCALCSEWDESSSSYSAEVAVLKQVPADSVPQKQTMTLATTSLDYNIQNMLVKFNRTSSTTHIDVVEYTDASLLETEIMAGNVPDLIDLNCMSEKALAAKGLLVDIYPYIDADSELDRSDFFENVLASLETNGCLYNVTPAFMIQTLAGAESIVGSESGWTYEDLYSALANMPEGCDILDAYTTRDTILQTGLFMDASEYYNTETGECNFKNDSFTQLLEFAARFPVEASEDSYYTDSSQRVASGEQMLVTAYFTDFDTVGQYDAMFGGSATFIGYPCTSGTGNLITVNNGIALTTACADKDAAWQFLRNFYTSEFQSSLTYYLPIRKDAFDAKIQKAMEVEYEKDANGNYLLDETGEKIPVVKMEYWVDGKTVSSYGMSQEQADKIYDTVTSSTRRISYDDSSVYDIVNEEAAAYFSGQKSAAEVEDIIQSRVSIYLREQM